MRLCESDEQSIPGMGPGSAFANLVDPSTSAGCFLQTLQTMEGQRLYSTAGGRVGIAARTTKMGDKICTFNGAPVLYVLHRVEDREQEMYSLVGDTFIHGLMHGEAAELEAEEQDFLLV